MPALVADRPFSQPLFDGVNRLATSAYKPARLGKSLLFGLSRRSGQTYTSRYQSTKYSENSPSCLRKSPFIRFSKQ